MSVQHVQDKTKQFLFLCVKAATAFSVS